MLDIHYFDRDAVSYKSATVLETLKPALDAALGDRRWRAYPDFVLTDGGRSEHFDLVVITECTVIAADLYELHGLGSRRGDDGIVYDDERPQKAPDVSLSERASFLLDSLKAVGIRGLRLFTGDIVTGVNESIEEILTPDQFFLGETGFEHYLTTLAGLEAVSTSGEDSSGSSLDAFFTEPRCCTSPFSYMAYRLKEVFFRHPDGLWTDAIAVGPDGKRALMRRWNLLVTKIFRSREQRILTATVNQHAQNFVRTFRPDLAGNLLPLLNTYGEKNLWLTPVHLAEVPDGWRPLLHVLDKPQSFPPRLRFNIVRSLIRVLAGFHEQGIAHGDLHGSSIWFSPKGEVKLANFASLTTGMQSRLDGTVRAVTPQCRVCPEDRIGVDAAGDFRRDLYAVGKIGTTLLAVVKSETSNMSRAGELLRNLLLPYCRQCAIENPSGRPVDAADIEQRLRKAEKVPLHPSRTPQDAAARFISNASLRLEHWLSAATTTDFGNGVGPFAGDGFVGRTWQLTKKTSLTYRGEALRSFTALAQSLADAKLSFIEEILDFGYTDDTVFVIRRPVEGAQLEERMLDPSFDDEGRLALAASLADIAVRLAGRGLAFGFLTQDNLTVTPGNLPVLTDLIQFQKHIVKLWTAAERSAPANLDAADAAVLPYAGESVPSPAELDTVFFANAARAVLGEERSETILRDFSGEDEVPTATGFSFTPATASLFLNAVARARRSSTLPVVELHLQENARVTFLNPLHGAFRLSVRAGRDAENDFFLFITGDRIALGICFDRLTMAPKHYYTKYLGFKTETVRHWIHMPVECRFRIIRDGITEERVYELWNAVLGLPGVRDYVREECSKLTDMLRADGLLLDAPDMKEKKAPYKDVASTWRLLMKAEARTFPLITIIGPGYQLAPKTAVYPYETLHPAPFAVDPDDEGGLRVRIRTGSDTNINNVAEVVRDKTASRYVTLRLTAPVTIRPGLQLQVASEKSEQSFRRRRGAVERILGNRARIEHLADYFDKEKAEHLCAKEYPLAGPDPADDCPELDESQREALRRVFTCGPVSFLQGPPGTGKTTFIAVFIHALLSRGVRRILLTSQSHEAVNNVLLRTAAVCRERGMPFTALRVGKPEQAGEALSEFLAPARLAAMASEARAKAAERLEGLGRSMGLSNAFIEDFRRFRRVFSGIARRYAESSDENALYYGVWLKRIAAREGLVFPENRQDAWNDLLSQYLARQSVSPNIISKLDRAAALSERWAAELERPANKQGLELWLAETSQIVCGTLVGLGRFELKLSEADFDWAIIDEAGRANGTETAVALQCARRVLFVGDHRQLPPVFTDDEMRAISAQANNVDEVTESDFGRIFETAYGRETGSMLQTQYRMTPVIGTLVSDCFYEGRLSNGRGTKPEFDAVFPAPLDRPATWIDTSSLPAETTDLADGTPRIYNRAEVGTVMGLLTQLSRIKGLPEQLAAAGSGPQIGVITFYAAQKELLLNAFSRMTWPEPFRRQVRIDTVDAYQGRENAVVILSTVRCNSREIYGFLTRAERINVSVSRAKEKLFIIGARRLWEGAGLPLSKVLAHIEADCSLGNAIIIPAESVTEDRK